MTLDDHLKQRYAELQLEYDLLTDEISALRNSLYTDDLSAKERLHVERQIKQAESKRDKIYQELEALDRNTNSEKLYRTLLKLGYEKQVRSFVRLIQKQKVSAFLIHGSVNYGQRWLLNNLVEQYVPASISGKKIRIELGCGVQNTGMNFLWRELGRRVGIKRFPSPSTEEITEEITKRVYHCWQTENVLLVFDRVNVMPQDYLEQLITEFWQPLAQKAIQGASRESDYQLLLFLVDREGTVGSLDHLFCDQGDIDKPHTPVRPPTISKFTSDCVEDWVTKQYQELPQQLTLNIEDTVQDILTESDQGIPEYVLVGIFERCGYDYYEEVRRLWKL